MRGLFVMMNIVMSGNGKSASWKIRGEQLGAAIGARVEPQPQSLKGVDAVIMVKRVNQGVLDRARGAGVPVIYDIVDAWQSTLGSDRSRQACHNWLVAQIKLVKPAAIVAATQHMATDCEKFGVPVLALPHHARGDGDANRIRSNVSSVGYEGAEAYLGWWRAVLENECERRRWKFVTNPAKLSDMDIVVAVRGDDNYASRHWKSGVKLANAQDTGTPCVLNREKGYQETASGAERWADDVLELCTAFDDLTDYNTRLIVSRELWPATPHLQRVASYYKEWLCSLKF